VSIADLVLLHNKATDAQAKKDLISVDVFDKIADVKREFIKFCKPYEERLRSNVKTHRVIPTIEEQTTDIMIPGFIVDKTAKGAKRLSPSKINLQFLEHHKKNYMDLHRDLAKISYSPQSDAALTNFKTLLELEISLLMGSDTQWAQPSETADPAAASAAGAVLGAAKATDDDDNSSNDDAAAADAPPAASAASAASARRLPAASAGGGKPPSASAAPAAPAPAASAGPAAPAAPAGGDGRGGAGGAGEGAAAHDPDDFTTWDHETWTDIDLSQIHFPTDPFVSICSVRSYQAVALLLVHIPSLRTAHPRVWDELNTAWSTTFLSDLSESALEKWPTTGPLAFSAEQCDWLSATLRYFKILKSGPVLRKRVKPACPAPAPAPVASGTSGKKANAAAIKRRRDPDPVEDTSR